MAIITVPKVLRAKLGEDGADALVELINRADEKNKQDVLAFVEEKFERRLTEEISKVNERITSEISKVNERISETKADLIRWMFIFWIGQIAAILGILFAFFRR